MVKVSDYVSSGKFHQGHNNTVKAARELQIEQVDEFILSRGTGPQPKKISMGLSVVRFTPTVLILSSASSVSLRRFCSWASPRRGQRL